METYRKYFLQNLTTSKLPPQDSNISTTHYIHFTWCIRLSMIQGKCKSLGPGSKKSCSNCPTHDTSYPGKDTCWGGGLLGCKHHTICNRREISELFERLHARGDNFRSMLSWDLVLNTVCGKNIYLTSVTNLQLLGFQAGRYSFEEDIFTVLVTFNWPKSQN